MNTLKAFVAAATLSLMSGISFAESAPKTTFKLYHDPTVSSARSASNGISVYDAEINLLDDYDHDGHYSRFEVNYDADDLSEYGLYAYTVVSLVEPDGDIRELFTSPTFYIDGDTNSDAQTHMVTLMDDFPANHFRLRIDLYDACCSSHLDTLITSAQEPIPLEGQYYDSDSYGETYVEEHHYVSESGSGGSWGFAGLGGLGLMYVLRRRRLAALLDSDDEND